MTKDEKTNPPAVKQLEGLERWRLVVTEIATITAAAAGLLHFLPTLGLLKLLPEWLGPDVKALATTSVEVIGALAGGVIGYLGARPRGKDGR